MDINKEQSSRLAEFRLALKFSQAKFADSVNYSRGYIAALELAKQPIQQRFIDTLCAIHHLNRDWFDTGEGEMFADVDVAEPTDEITVNRQSLIAAFETLPESFQNFLIDVCVDLLKKKEETAQNLDASSLERSDALLDRGAETSEEKP